MQNIKPFDTAESSGNSMDLRQQLSAMKRVLSYMLKKLQIFFFYGRGVRPRFRSRNTSRDPLYADSH